MIFILSRLLRLETEYRGKIALQERGRGDLLPGEPLGCVMVNISRKGACLVLSKILLEGRHLFFTALNNDQYHLVLLLVNPKTGEESFEIPASSVWMDSCIYKKQPAFKIGLCFHERQKKLFRLFKR
jgi:hypothetical protein